MSETESVHSPLGDLEQDIRRGDFDALVNRLGSMEAGARARFRSPLVALRERLEAFYWRPEDPALQEWWGGILTKAQRRALDAATFLCGRGTDLGWSMDAADMIELGHHFAPVALEDIACGKARLHFRKLQELIVAGLVPRPASDDYVLGFMAEGRWRKTVDEILARDPGLLPDTVLRLLEVEGTTDVSLAAVDKYSTGIGTWMQFFLDLCAQGMFSRALLLDKALTSLEHDWIQFRSGWFSRFHALLAPTTAEMAPHARRYLGLCLSRIPPTVTMALQALDALHAAGVVDDAALLQALEPVLSSSVKGQVESALKLLDRIVKQAPERAAAAAGLAVRALGHDAPDIHKKVLARLKAWGLDDDTRQLLADMESLVSAANRPALAALLGTAVPVRATTLVELPARAAPLSPLDPSRRLEPIQALDDLVERSAYLLEHPEDGDEAERVLEALVRMAVAVRAAGSQFAPVLKRAKKLKQAPALDIGNFLLALLEGGEIFIPAWSSDYHLRPGTAHALFVERLGSWLAIARAGRELPPLSVASHRRGFIAPAILIERLAAYYRQSCVPAAAEVERALLRLAPGATADDLAAARRLPDRPEVRALRYALGDEVAPGPERALFLAASAVRHAGGEDRALMAAYGGSAGQAVRYHWHFESRESGEYVFHKGKIDSTPAVANDHNSGLAQKLRDLPTGQGGEAMLVFQASLLPACLEAFFACGALTLSNNLDWWEAQWDNRAYLQLLRDPTVPITPMALLTLAFGLLGKEPGQTAIAVDATVEAWLQGRLDAAQLGLALRNLLATPLAKAARCRRALDLIRQGHDLTPHLAFRLLNHVMQQEAAPPRGFTDLLELLLELKLDLGLALDTAAVTALKRMSCTGKARTLQKQLVAD